MSGSLNLGSISTRLRRIARLAREDRERSFLSLAHHIDEHWLWEAYARTRKDAAAGIDGLTAKQYEENLGGNLRSLLDRFKSELVNESIGGGESADWLASERLDPGGWKRSAGAGIRRLHDGARASERPRRAR